MRFRLLIEYDGTDYAGWQVQKNKRTVQGDIEQSLELVLKHRVRVIGAGRTDSGVHAWGQVAHFDSDLDVEPALIKRSLNGILRKTIRIKQVDSVEPEFHARFSAKWRSYRYQISPVPVALSRNYVWHISYNLNLHQMQSAADQIVGIHDFRSFARSISAVPHHVCEVAEAIWQEEKELIIFKIRANRFLHGMIRALVGTFIDIGRGKLPVNDFSQIFVAYDRKRASQSAPARGLILEQVEY
jgi:tRNA pseudouridine38-40 synthase